MRRFIATLPGKVISNVLVAALVLPYMVLGLAAKGHAQLRSLPAWAVVDFVNKKDKSAPAYGADAAKAVNGSLSRTGKYDMQSPEAVALVVERLGLSQPLPDLQNILRVASELKVQTIVSGEVIEYRIDKSAAGKQARAAIRVICYDVASGLPVNGSAVSASSILRSSDVEDNVLVNDAISQAAALAADQISKQTLPSGTVLNTSTGSALINSGSRTGFQTGQKVVITRGRQQVGTGEITDLGPDKSTIKITRSDLGIQPGDKVRAIIDVPVITPKLNADGSANIVRPKAKSNPSGFVTTLLVLGLVAFLVGGGGKGDAIAAPIAEAYNDPTNGASVKISWKPNGYAKGTASRQSWQIFRSDLIDTAVRSVGGANTVALDDTFERSVTWTVLPSNNFAVCNGNSTQNLNPVAGVTSGRPYQYQVQLVFALPTSDVISSAGGSGTTATGTTATGTTATGTTATGTTATGTTATGTTATGTTATGTTATGTTATGTTATGTTATGTTAGSLCFFLSDKTPTIGFATPIVAPGLVAPASGATLTPLQKFTFNSVANPQYDQTFEYQLQVSSTLNFTPATTYKKVLMQTRDTGTLGSEDVDLVSDSSLPASVKAASLLYWRIGARNVLDKPGPVPDVFTGDRYIFSSVNQLKRPGVPPPPPSL